jgi:hypothetical protein
MQKAEQIEKKGGIAIVLNQIAHTCEMWRLIGAV